MKNKLLRTAIIEELEREKINFNWLHQALTDLENLEV